MSETSLVWYYKNTERAKKNRREWYRVNQARESQKQRDRYWSNREYNLRRRKEYRLRHMERERASSRARWARKAEQYRQAARRTRRKLREEILSKYGGRCACCGEDQFEFLAIDHINGGGTKHHKVLRSKNTTICTWLRKNKFPNGFRVLCHNCNNAIGWYGACPHQRKKKKP